MNPLALMKVVKTLSMEVPGLGSKIKAAREADPRTLKSICELAGMSPMNWYRIEEEKQTLPLETLRKIEEILRVDFEIDF